MTVSQNRISVSSGWQNIVADNSALGSVDVLIQNLDDDYVDVVCAASAEGKGPVRLDTFDSLQVNAAAIWVRGDGTISATLL